MHSFAPKQKSPSPAARPMSRDSKKRPDFVALHPADSARCGDESADLRAHPVFAQGLIQPKLTIGAPNDPLELEADRVAEQVMRMPEPCAQCADPPGGDCSPPETPPLRMKSTPSGEAGGIAAPPIVHEALKSSGRPLDDKTRAFFEPRFGRDFADVRIHDDAQANNAAAAISARAFTAGMSIVFGSGEYSTLTGSGRTLLAHEMAHVAQQNGAASGSTIRSAPIPGKTPLDNLDNKKITAALQAADLVTLLDSTIGKNVLNDLSLTRPTADQQIGVLEAGALAFTLGMLRQRAQFKSQNKKIFGKTIDNFSEHKKVFDAPTAADRINRKKMAIKYILEQPDWYLEYKRYQISVVVQAVVPDISLNIDPLSKAIQAETTNSIKAYAESFFERMKELGWIKQVAGGSDIQMPDQLLAAVGDATESTGLANVTNAGVGYFMYSNEEAQRHQFRPANSLRIGFPQQGDLSVRMSAYGFDTDEQGKNENKYPTDVLVSAGSTLIAKLQFTREGGIGVSRVLPETTGDIGRNVVAGAITLTIPEKYRTAQGGIVFKTQAHKNETGAFAEDRDEIQVQFSTNGGIAENRVPEKTFTSTETVTYIPGAKIMLPRVLFDTDKATLKSESNATLDGLVDTLTRNPDLCIEIEGHTDDQGAADHNQVLSENRARAVLEYLTAHNIKPSRLRSRGYGETMPEYDNKTDQGRAGNRRVVAKVLAPLPQ